MVFILNFSSIILQLRAQLIDWLNNSQTMSLMCDWLNNSQTYYVTRAMAARMYMQSQARPFIQTIDKNLVLL
jgi:hypothetical protein